MKKIFTNTSYEAYNKTIELIKFRLNSSEIDTKEEKHIVVVPKQFTATVRLGIYNDIVGSNSKILVTSFEEMSKDYLKNSRFKFISKESSILLINKSVYELSKQKKIRFFANSHRFENFSEMLYSTIKSLVESGVSAEDINNIEEKIPEKLKHKLNEIYLIYDKYLDSIRENCLDSITVMEALADEISTGIENNNYYILDFFSLNKQQLKLVKRMEENAKTCTVAFSTTIADPNSYVYKNKIHDQIVKFIEENNKESELISSNEKLPEDIENVSKYIFSYEQPKEINKINNNRVNLLEFSEIDAEVKNIALDILEGIQSNQRFRDYQIFCCDMEKYQFSIQKIFTRFNIPFHLDIKYRLEDQGKIQFLLDALNVVNTNFERNEVLRFVFNPLFSPDFFSFTDMTETVTLIGNFEKYVKDNFISGMGEKRSFKFKFQSKENSSDEEKSICQNAEIIRDKVIKLFNNLDSKKKSVSKWIEILKQLSTLSGLNSTWDIYVSDLGKIEPERQRVAQQVDSKLEELYSLMDELIDYECDLDEFLFIFKGVLSSVSIATIPASIDRVHVGSFNSRFIISDNMYLLGADSDSIPKTSPEGVIITHSDEKKLVSAFKGNNQIYMQDAETDMTNNMISIIEFIKKCRKKLVISCTTGGDCECSIIYKQLNSIFKNLETIKVTSSLRDTLLLSDKSKYTLINKETQISAFAEHMDEWNEITPKQKNDILEIVGIRHTDFESIEELPKNINHKYTLAKKMTFSPTSIEQYSKCPYMYYLSSIIGISVDYDYSDPKMAESIFRGNLSHKYLELFINDYINNQIPNKISLDNRFENFYVPEAEKVIPDFLNTIGTFQDMMAITKESIKQVIDSMYDNLSNETAIFNPLKCEASLKEDKDFNISSLTVGYDEDTKSPNEVTIAGRIDRIDVSKSEYDGEKYYAIYDYKTSNSSNFKKSAYSNVTEILNEGKKVQLPFYMLALESKGYNIGEIAYINVKNDYRQKAKSAYEVSTLVMDDFYEKINPNSDNKKCNSVVSKKDLLEATKKIINEKAKEIKNGLIEPTCSQCKENYRVCNFKKICKYASILRREGAPK